jgi:uncharacterized coiled-coil DUF342 family protein
VTDADVTAIRALAARVHATGDTALVGYECRFVAQSTLGLCDEVERLRRERDAHVEELANLRRAVEEYLPHPNGDRQTEGNPDAWNAAMFNLGKLKEERDAARQQLAAVQAERDAAVLKTLAERELATQIIAANAENVRNETAEAIATWLDAWLDLCADVQPTRALAEQIRAGAWRTK